MTAKIHHHLAIMRLFYVDSRSSKLLSDLYIWSDDSKYTYRLTKNYTARLRKKPWKMAILSWKITAWNNQRYKSFSWLYPSQNESIAEDWRTSWQISSFAEKFFSTISKKADFLKVKAHRVKFILGDIGTIARCDCSERIFDFLRTLDVLGFFANHKRHVLLEGNVTISVRVDHICKTKNSFNQER